MEKNRILRLRTPAPTGAAAGSARRPRYRYGSGYLIGPERVLTVAHALVRPGADGPPAQPGDPCQVLPWTTLAASSADSAWMAGEVACCDAELDVAVVTVPGLGSDVAPVRWGQLAGSDILDWEATGFPAAGADAVSREPEHVYGTVSPLTREPTQRLGLTVESRTARLKASGKSGWAGFSGAALFVGGRLVGVVHAEPLGFGGGLSAVRITATVANAEVFAALGQPDLEPVTKETGSQRQQAIEGFLVALRERSEELPYLAIQQIAERGNRKLPLLSQIYIEQQQESPPEVPDPASAATQAGAAKQETPAAAQAKAEGQVTVRETAEQALDQYDHLLVDGRAGIGKSTLLHHLATAGVDGEVPGPGLLGPGDRGVPVRVTARRLVASTGSFGGALREAVTAELGLALPQNLPDDVFQRPPVRGRRWLVLIDALDEVVDGAARKRLLASLRLAATRRDLYRLVVTSRPAPDLTDFATKTFAYYRLLPFGREQMLEFVERWFAARSDEAEADAEQFIQQVDDSRITELAATPLLLTMAALISEESPHRGLPPGRAQLYRDFVAMLLDEESTRRTRDGFVEEWRQRYGPEGEACAHHLFDSRQELLVDLARWQFDDQLVHDSAGFVTEHATALIADGIVPDHVAQPWLCSQLELLLGRTGVVVYRSGDLQFVHETFREFFVAAGLARSMAPDSKEACDLAAQWHYHGLREVVLFTVALLSLAKPDRQVTLLLREIWDPRKKTEEGLFAATDALADGIGADEQYEASVVGKLAAIAGAEDSWYRPTEEAIAGLARLHRRSELQELAATAPLSTRATVGRVLLDVGEYEAARAVLVAVAESEEGLTGVWAAETLAERFDRDPGLGSLRAVLVSRSASDDARVEAAQALVRLGCFDVPVERLRELADDGSLDADARVTAARLHVAFSQEGATLDGVTDNLQGSGGEWGDGELDASELVSRTLLAISHETAGPARDRIRAADALLDLGRPDDALPVLIAVATTTTIDDVWRQMATNILSRPPIAHEVRDVLAAVVDDRTADFDHRLIIATRLVEDGHATPGAERILRRRAGRRRPWSDRAEAIAAATSMATLGDLGPLRRLATSRFIGSYDRLSAAEALAELGELDALRAVVARRRLDDGWRLEGAATLARHGDTTALTRVATSARAASSSRVDAAEKLAAQGDLGPLRALVDDRAVTDGWRVSVARSLAERGDVAPLRHLAESPEFTTGGRLEAFSALVMVDPDYDAARGLRAVATDDAVLPELRQDAVMRLARLDHRDEAVEILVGLTEDESWLLANRLDAAVAVAELGEADRVLATVEVLARGRLIPTYQRMRAAEFLNTHDQAAEALAAYRAIAEDRSVDPTERSYAANQLADLGAGDEAARILLGMGADQALPVDVRTSAAVAGAKLGHTGAAIPILRSVVDDAELGVAHRVAAARELIEVGSLRDLVAMASAPREAAVAGRLPRLFGDELVSAANVGGGTAARRAARALGSTPRPKAVWRHPGEVILGVLRLAVIGGVALAATLVVLEAGEWLADHWGPLRVPRPWQLSGWMLGAVVVIAYLRLVYRLDNFCPARPFVRVATRGLFCRYTVPRASTLARHRLFLPLAVAHIWAWTVVSITAASAVGVPDRVALYGTLLGFLAFGGAWLSDHIPYEATGRWRWARQRRPRGEADDY